MTVTATQWKMLKDELRDRIEAQQGFRVTHAVFTTYAFEPAFFEASILPQLLPDGERNLSLHSAVRRLQLESILRSSPVGIDVYFDARVAMLGCPLLPYDMHPVRMSHGEFHGKVVLLRLQDAKGNVRCILGSGSANLTQAGWWENMEAWYFADSFDPAKTPAGIHAGLVQLLDFLAESSPAGPATRQLRLEIAPSSGRARRDEPSFGAFTPSGPEPFPAWLQRRVSRRAPGGRIEVISPYFCESDPKRLVQTLLDCTRASCVDVWLPEDPWQAAGPAALIEEGRYDALTAVETLQWCRLGESGLAGERKREGTPRFLHAKVLRQPGQFCFMGSVNFSHKAFHQNFEAGFLFRDEGTSWLTPHSDRPKRFLKPAEHECLDETDDDVPNVVASFNWRTAVMTIEGMRKDDKRALCDVSFSVIDVAGRTIAKRLVAPAEFKVVDSLRNDLRTNPWIRLTFFDGRKGLVWVRQSELDYRPPSEDLTPGVWRILEMWRGLADGRSGSQPGDFEAIEIVLRHRALDEEAPPAGEAAADVFQIMSAVHGSFHLLRRRLRDDPARREYYFSAPRPDTLRSLVERFDRPASEDDHVDPIAKWVILQWIAQICCDHRKDIAGAKSLHRRANAHLQTLLASKPLCDLDERFLEWARRMFLCNPGAERRVTNHFKRMENQA